MRRKAKTRGKEGKRERKERVDPVITNPIYISHYNNTPSKDPIVACAHPKLNQSHKESDLYRVLSIQI